MPPALARLASAFFGVRAYLVDAGLLPLAME
jgi:hypothetical protein